MQKNVGDADAYLRISLGLTMLGIGIIHQSRMSVTIGAMKVAEGVTRWCPMLQMLGMSTCSQCRPESENSLPTI